MIRNIDRPEVRLEEFNSGTETEVGGGSLSIPGGISVLPAIPAAPIPAPVAPQPAIPSTLGSPAPAAGPQR